MIKERYVRVMIENLDMSKYVIGQVQSINVEPKYIGITNISEAETEIKKETEIDEKCSISETENTVVQDNERKAEFLDINKKRTWREVYITWQSKSPVREG